MNNDLSWIITLIMVGLLVGTYGSMVITPSFLLAFYPHMVEEHTTYKAVDCYDERNHKIVGASCVDETLEVTVVGVAWPFYLVWFLGCITIFFIIAVLFRWWL